MDRKSLRISYLKNLKRLLKLQNSSYFKSEEFRGKNFLDIHFKKKYHIRIYLSFDKEINKDIIYFGIYIDPSIEAEKLFLIFKNNTNDIIQLFQNKIFFEKVENHYVIEQRVKLDLLENKNKKKLDEQILKEVPIYIKNFQIYEKNMNMINVDEYKDIILSLKEKKMFKMHRLKKVKPIKNNNRSLYYRDPELARSYLLRCEYKCEYDELHKTFLSKNNKMFMEIHHFIPLSYFEKFEYNLDSLGNLICLCPNCHAKFHYGNKEEVEKMIEKFYPLKIDSLRECGLDISLEDLKTIYLDKQELSIEY